MDITTDQLIEQLNAMPKAGMIEVDIDGDCLFIESATGHYEALSEQTVKFTGRSGYGMLTFSQSTTIVDVEKIKYVRHASEGTP